MAHWRKSPARRGTIGGRVVATNKPPRIVAELGRPETPAETAARKAATSKTHRENQTMLNLLVALGISLIVVLIIVAVVVRPDAPPAEPVDYQTTAEQVQPQFDETIVSPVLPDGWRANAARVEKGADGISSWYVGFVTPSTNFAAMTQGIDANPTWLAAQLRNGFATGTETIAGITWDVYDRRDAEDPGNLAYALTTTVGASTIVLFGTAPNDEFTVLAEAVAHELEGTTR